MFTDSSVVLVIAAHPDDEVIGCGGTIARLTQMGHEVYISILGEGITSRQGQSNAGNQEEVKALHAISQQVANILRIKDIFFYSLPDNRFDSMPLLEVVKIIEGLIARLKPQVVFTQHGGDLNIDHTITFRATLTATRPTFNHPVREVYAYEVASSTEWGFQKFEPHFRPNYFVDITETLEKKIMAMSYYQSEVRTFPHPRSPEALKSISRRWGSVAGLQAAEAFELVRAIR